MIIILFKDRQLQQDLPRMLCAGRPENQSCLPPPVTDSPNKGGVHDRYSLCNT